MLNTDNPQKNWNKSRRIDFKSQSRSFWQAELSLATSTIHIPNLLIEYLKYARKQWSRETKKIKGGNWETKEDCCWEAKSDRAEGEGEAEAGEAGQGGQGEAGAGAEDEKEGGMTQPWLV